MTDAEEDVTVDAGMLQFCQRIPKLELHAHLNGSLRDATIRELATAKLGDVFDPTQYKIDQHRRTLTDCFALFKLVHDIVNTPEIVARVTREAIEDLAADGVVYIELRTTPRTVAETGMTQRGYVEACVNEIAAMNANPDCAATTRLLLSIDRRQMTLNEAINVVRLAREFRDDRVRNDTSGHSESIVVGVDFSGDPTQGTLRELLPALEIAQGQGLKTSVHFAEIDNFGESRRLLAFRPDRLAHACTVTGQLFRSMVNAPRKPPLELCLTSNVLSGSVPSYAQHHIKAFYAEEYPIALCTDDMGAFSTSCSRELALAAAILDLPREEVFRLAESALEYIFALESTVKSALGERFAKAKRELLPATTATTGGGGGGGE